MQGPNPRHLATFTSSLVQKENLEQVEGFTQDDEQMNSKGRVLTSPSCHPSFVFFSVFFWLSVPELPSTADGSESPANAPHTSRV